MTPLSYICFSLCHIYIEAHTFNFQVVRSMHALAPETLSSATISSESRSMVRQVGLGYLRTRMLGIRFIRFRS